MSIDKQRIEFAKRVSLALDQLPDCPPHDSSGRTSYLARLFDVSPQNARRWLKGLHMPESMRLVEVAEKLKVQLNWLMTGRGIMTSHLSDVGIDYKLNPVIMIDVLAWVRLNYKIEVFDGTSVDPEVLSRIMMVVYHMIERGSKPDNLDKGLIEVAAQNQPHNNSPA